MLWSIIAYTTLLISFSPNHYSFLSQIFFTVPATENPPNNQSLECLPHSVWTFIRGSCECRLFTMSLLAFVIGDVVDSSKDIPCPLPKLTFFGLFSVCAVGFGLSLTAFPRMSGRSFIGDAGGNGLLIVRNGIDRWVCLCLWASKW